MSRNHSLRGSRAAGQAVLEVLLITALVVLLLVSFTHDSPLDRLMASLESQHARLLRALSLP
jgi:hypothetical protein